ncbi:MAG: CotH kinase family protein [Spirosomataceae bacterium]
MMRFIYKFLIVGVCCHVLLLGAASAQSFIGSLLPIIVIKTNGQLIKDEPKVVVDMGIIYKGKGVRNYSNDPFNAYEGKAAIEFRGSTSQTLSPKKPYGFETQDEQGNNRNVSLLGLPEENDWVLLAPYSDKSLVRDAFTYDIARQIYHTWVPRTQFCEVMVDYQYQGLYVLTEKIKRDKNRVNIAELKKTDNEGDQLTGGYIVKLDKFTGGPSASFNSPYKSMAGGRITYQIEYPDIKDITDAQQSYIAKYITDFEQVLNSANFNDPQNGYAKWIDFSSFVDYFIMTELSKNVDGYRFSTYFYKQKDSQGGKIVMGPLWDYNIAYGAGDFCDNWTPTGWQFEQYKVCYTDIPFWWSRLVQDKTFTSAVMTRWQSLRKGIWSDEKLFSRLDSTVNAIGEARIRNFQRWNILSTKVWSNYYAGGNYGAEYDYLRFWLSDRLLWLDAQLPVLAGVVTATEPSTFSWNLSPNPAGNLVNIAYQLPQATTVKLEAFDMTGRSVQVLVQEATQAGLHHFSWQHHLPSGSYLLTLQAEGQPTQTKKLVIW